MVYTKQSWVEYDENLSEQQNIEVGAVVTSNKLNHMESGIDAESKKVSDIELTLKNLSYYTQLEVDEMLIKLIAGEKISATFTMDYKKKIANSIVENPNIFYYGAGGWTDLKKPYDPSWGEYIQRHVDDVSQLDNRLFETLRYNVNVIAQSWLKFDIAEDFKRKLPFIFNNLSASESIIKIKKTTSKAGVESFSKGSNSAGNRVTMSAFSNSNYGLLAAHASNEIKKLSFYHNSFMDAYLDNTGNVNILLNAEPSDGKVASSLYIDYASLDYTVELSLRDIFTTKEELKAHASDINNPHKVTKTQIGLGVVDNVQQATKTEFNAHTSNKSNPHGVTASQTGAYTKKETDDLLNKKLNIQTPPAWINLPLVSGYTTAEGNTPMYRIALQFDGSRKVEFKGQVKKTNGQFPANAPSQFATIPASAKPKTNIFYHGGTNTAVGGRLVAENNGNIQLLASVATDYVVLDVLTYTL